MKSKDQILVILLQLLPFVLFGLQQKQLRSLQRQVAEQEKMQSSILECLSVAAKTVQASAEAYQQLRGKWVSTTLSNGHTVIELDGTPDYQTIR